jgi:glutamine amidotransferase
VTECTIIDYGMGNLGSIGNMLKKIGTEYRVSSEPDVIATSNRLILPGVGAFESGMENLRERGLIAPLERAVLERKVPILGICLGMHLFTRRSEEGGGEGLGWVAADSVKFRSLTDAAGRSLKVPHMGWNLLKIQPYSRLFEDWKGEARFYFVHSYHVSCDDPKLVAGETDYGGPFTSSIDQDNIFGVQFHPEKSHRFGMRLLTRFVSL